MNELGWIETYFMIGFNGSEIAQKLDRAKQTIYNVVNSLKEGHSIQCYYERYQTNKKRCGVKKKCFTQDQVA